MNSVLIYLIKVSLAMCVFYLPYVLVFQKTTYFKINRFFLLGSLFFSLSIPFIHFYPSAINGPVTFSSTLEPITITAKSVSSNRSSIHFLTLIQFIYISGTFIFTFLFLHRFIQLVRLIRRHQVSHVNGIKLVRVEKDFAPASFFNYVFISACQEKDEILAHEKAHVTQGHSWDIMILELAILIFWFNPLVWMYRKSLRNLHEFLADETAMEKGHDRADYQQLVFEHTFGLRLNALAVSFNYSPLKKRLIMMTKNKSNQKMKWQYLLILPVIVASIFYFGCENSTSSDIPDNVAQELEGLGDKEAFDVVDQMPEYPGGIDAMKKHLALNVKYPDEAKENGISGRIYVQFIVNSQGKVTKAKALRTKVEHKINAGENESEVVVVGYRENGELTSPKNANITSLEEESLRVVNNLSDFKPGVHNGKKVSVYYTVPINFELQ